MDLTIVAPDMPLLIVPIGIPGSGKALDIATPILTPQGFTKLGDLQVGDLVFGSDGKPTKILAKSEMLWGRECFEVRADDGASVVADASHLWNVDLHESKILGFYRQHPLSVICDTRVLNESRHKRPRLNLSEALEMKDSPLLIHPYALGVWLGDGNSRDARLTCVEDEILIHLEEVGEPARRVNDVTCTWAGSHKNPSTFRSRLRDLGVLNQKYIPESYLYASAQQRLALLQGLIDTDGYVGASGAVEFCNMNQQLAEGVQFLVRSLGRKATLKIGNAMLNGKFCGLKYRVSFYLKDCARLSRKQVLTRDAQRTSNRYLTTSRVESRTVQCIQVAASDGLFLAGEGLMVTHNSTLLNDAEGRGLDVGARLGADDIRTLTFGSRKVLGGDEIFEALLALTKARLLAGKDSAYDCTNLSVTRRRPVLYLAKEITCHRVALLSVVPYEVAFTRNEKRPKHERVPNEVLDRMQTQLDRVDVSGLKREGFDDVIEFDDEITGLEIKR